MKKEKDIIVKWKDLLIETKRAPEGYSSAIEIAEKLGMPHGAVREKLRDSRRKGNIEAVEAKSKSGRIIWYYKD